MNNDIKKIILHRPAFLIGNGINYVNKENNLSWTKLLIDLFPEKYRSKIVTESSNVNLNLDGLTYPEIAELAIRYTKEADSTIKRPDCIVKKNICKKVDDFENKLVYLKKIERHKTVITFAKKNSIPVLTTNYDFLLLKTLKIIFSKNNNKFLKKKVEEPFWFFDVSKRRPPYNCPFCAYFRETELQKNSDVKKEFAIWYIHGMKRYSSSLCITNKDYSKIIANLNKFIKDKSIMNKDKWEGFQTWINPFMNDDLLIMGLKLDSEEVDLRWLLVERYLYQQYLMNNSRNYTMKKTVYVYSDDNELPNGKKLFFEAIGIECEKIDYDNIYKLDYLDIRDDFS